MTRLIVFRIIKNIIVVFCVLQCLQVQAQPQSKSRLIQQTQKVLTQDHGLITVHAVQKFENQYVLMDRKNVIYTDLLFNRQKTFDSEACHPGSPFNPNRISRVGEKHLIIASTPVLSYLVNLESGECSTRLGASIRLIPDYMTQSESGFLNLLKSSPDIIELASYSDDMTPIYLVSMRDNFPFNKLRYRLRNGNSILKYVDEILILNGLDFSVMRIKDSEISNKTYKVDVLTIPISNVNKPIGEKNNISGLDDFISVVAGKHYINAMYFGKGSQLLFNVLDVDKQENSLYECNYDNSGITNCLLLKHFPRGEEVRYAENGEVITIKVIEDVNSFNGRGLIKYTIH